MNRETEIREILASKKLKITPQRVVVLNALRELKNHPTADDIIDHLRADHPNIAVGTIYKILDTLVEKRIIERVKTERDIMRYDAIPERHHHIYCAESDRIVDFFDPELDNLLEEYFISKKIPGFSVEDVKLQIIGKFSGSTGDKT